MLFIILGFSNQGNAQDFGFQEISDSIIQYEVGTISGYPLIMHSQEGYNAASNYLRDLAGQPKKKRGKKSSKKKSSK